MIDGACTEQTFTGAGAAVQRKPQWLKRPVAFIGKNVFVAHQCWGAKLHTVCEEAKCPNKAECWARGSAAFLIMGATCSRRCGFCNVRQGTPDQLDEDEPNRLCDAVRRLGLRHVVITSVTRDDLSDGGAAHFARTVGLLRRTIPDCAIEILVPDFNGNKEALKIVLRSRPDVFNHNIETVSRLYPAVRPKASYQRSLRVLAEAAKHGEEMIVKSGIMAGLGETSDEVEAALLDLRAAGCSMVTLGQYLQPSRNHLPVREYISPELFKQYESAGRAMGFTHVFAGPYVRSSYKAEEIFSTRGRGFLMRTSNND